MNKQELSLKRKHLRDQNRLYGPVMLPLSERDWPDYRGWHSVPESVWRSKNFLAFIYREGLQIRISVNRAELDDNGMFRDGITWEELQRIKYECGYGDREAVEIYPPEKDVVNVANMRHLWILNKPLPFMWRKSP